MWIKSYHEIINRFPWRDDDDDGDDAFCSSAGVYTLLCPTVWSQLWWKRFNGGASHSIPISTQPTAMMNLFLWRWLDWLKQWSLRLLFTWRDLYNANGYGKLLRCKVLFKNKYIKKKTSRTFLLKVVNYRSCLIGCMQPTYFKGDAFKVLNHDPKTKACSS